MKAIIPIVCALLLAACGGADDRGKSAEERAETTDLEGFTPPVRAPDGIMITAVGDLVGEYRVAGIDGQPLNADFGIAVSIDGPMLSFEPTCAGFVWDISFEGEVLSLPRHASELAVTSTAPDDVPPPAPLRCTVGLLPEWEQLASALDNVTHAERLASNAVRLSGVGRSVTLYSQ